MVFLTAFLENQGALQRDLKKKINKQELGINIMFCFFIV